MITKQYTISYYPKNELEESIFSTDSIFFDIETTGFSPVKNQLYLIGCGYRDENNLHIIQYFAESRQEEADILQAFLSLLFNFKTILSFNGLGFDLPFLKSKCSTLGISACLDSFTYIDIFKSISKYKKILNLENYKQKTLELFLDIAREDTCSGGDLIPVYQSYEKDHTNKEALSLLLLHNHDDVLGMIPLIQLLSYEKFFSGHFKVTEIKEHAFLDFQQQPALELLFSGEVRYQIPKRIFLKKDFMYLLAEDTHFSLSVTLLQDTLKYFYPDYKNYYYLPKEDMAIHKSVATYVEKEYRTPAKASNCYTKKEGTFLPQYDTLFSPAFQKNPKDKLSFFQYEKNKTFKDEKQRNLYIKNLLSHITD